MISETLREIVNSQIVCQCNKCNEVFNYTQVKNATEEIYGIKTVKKVCPYCGSTFSRIDKIADKFFDKHLYINYDQRYFD